MQAEDPAARLMQAAKAHQSDMRSVLRLEQIAIKGACGPALVTPMEVEELCALVLRHLTGDPSRPGS